MPNAATRTTASSAVSALRAFRPGFRSWVCAAGGDGGIEGGGPKLTRGSSSWSWDFPAKG